MCLLAACERSHPPTDKVVQTADPIPSSSIEATGRALVASPPRDDDREVLDAALRGVRIDGSLLVVDSAVAPSVVPNPSREAALTEIQAAERALAEYRTIDAIAGFTRAVINDPSSVAAFDGHARALVRVREYSVCAAACAAGLRLDAQQPAIRAQYALALQGMSRDDEATAQWRAVIELDPSHRGARGRLAVLLYYAGQYDESRRWLTDAEARGDIVPTQLWALLAESEGAP